EPDAVASLPLALRHAVRCCDGETAAILLASAMERGLLAPSEVQQILDDSPRTCRSRIGPLSSARDSGTETRGARWPRRRGCRGALLRRGAGRHPARVRDGAGSAGAVRGAADPRRFTP